MFAKIGLKTVPEPLPSDVIESPAPEAPPSKVEQMKTSEELAIETMVKLDTNRRGKGKKVRDRLRTWRFNAKQALNAKQEEGKRAKASREEVPEVYEEDGDEDGDKEGDESGSGTDDDGSSSDSEGEGATSGDGDDREDEVSENPQGAEDKPYVVPDIEMSVVNGEEGKADAEDSPENVNHLPSDPPLPPPGPPPPSEEEKKKRMKAFRLQKTVETLKHGGKAIQSLYQLWQEQMELKNEYIEEETYMSAQRQKSKLRNTRFKLVKIIEAKLEKQNLNKTTRRYRDSESRCRSSEWCGRLSIVAHEADGVRGKVRLDRSDSKGIIRNIIAYQNKHSASRYAPPHTTYPT